MFSFDETSNSVKAQQLHPLKTRAKDDVGKTYWVYSDEENVDTYEEKHILSVRPSLTLAKNIKRKEPVFALLNREFIEAFSSDRFFSRVHATLQPTLSVCRSVGPSVGDT